MINTTTKSFDTFEADARKAGFDEAKIRDWPPQKVIDTHTHTFHAEAIVTLGEIWLTCGESTRHLLPGDTFTLSYGQPHAERYGVEGATYWVARRNRPVDE